MTRPELWDLFASHPIADALFPYLTVADVYKLHRVCKPLQSSVLRLQDTYLNIHCALKDFVTRPDSFRYNLGRAKALIIGPFVVNFLGYRQHDNTFLDILVEQGPPANNLIQYLCVEEPYQNAGSSEVGNQLILSRPGFTTKIRVTETDKTPIHTLLERSYTTLDLCFMSWNKLYVMFPLATLVHHQFWPLRELDDIFGARLNDLATQGWTTRDLVWVDFAKELLSGLGARRVGDENSLAMPLMPALACTGLTPDYVLELSEFDVNTRVPVQTVASFATDQRRLFPQLQPNAAQNRNAARAPELMIKLEELKSPSLRHRYTTSESGAWHGFALKRLKRWTEVELYKMDRDKRPTNFPGSPLPSDFELPATWDSADDQMPIWYRECHSKNDPCKLTLLS
ncbi:hypothetical protein NLG97_g4397 [Lecanicillium saksenae]|uniref:Uncharacterized protein n=1 Tax=Lecanicillium saksenae TaxID=468837 RepID=A0ACC1QY09_9HYPO|nr:hypothetical protein NLG97_g4397 [Lecanicillium saksenae]